jgi:hypothetical protein
LIGPVALVAGAYTTNIYAIGTSWTSTSPVGVVSGSIVPYVIIRHIHIANKLAADTFRLYLGASAGNVAGTELFFDQAVGAKGTYDWYGAFRMDSGDFLVGGAATTLTLVLTAYGEVGA